MFAEYCNGQPKQLWSLFDYGGDWYRFSNGLSAQCLAQAGTTTQVYVGNCADDSVRRIWEAYL